MAHALDRHAEKAFAELTTDRQKLICEKTFKALTDRSTDPRGIRRPMKFAKLCQVVAASDAELVEVLAVFRKPSRSFLVPEQSAVLNSDSVIDISHESLMRIWTRLKTWTDEEAEATREFKRISDRAAGYGKNLFGLMQDPDLETALAFERKQQPTDAWADLYGGGLQEARLFLRKSERQRDDMKAEQELDRQWQSVWQPSIFAIVALSFLVALLQWREALLPPSRNLSIPVYQRSFEHDWLNLLISFGKITFLAIPFAFVYGLLIRLGKRLHRRFARVSVYRKIRNSNPATAPQKPISDVAEFLATTYAPWWRRATAFIIDTVVGFILFVLAVGTIGPFGLRGPTDIRVDYATWFAYLCLYHAITVGWRWKATLGMLAARIYVTDLRAEGLSPWKAALRQFLKWLVFPISFYWPLLFWGAKWAAPDRKFVKRKQWLGDIISGSVILVKAPRGAKLPAPAIPPHLPSGFEA